MVAVGVGTELVPKDAVKAGAFDVVTARAREFTAAVRALPPTRQPKRHDSKIEGIATEGTEVAETA